MSDECANGSWAPEKDAWGRRGGRVMQTSLSCLTLEIYYRYLPLFKADAAGGDGGGAAVAAGKAAPARPTPRKADAEKPAEKPPRRRPTPRPTRSARPTRADQADKKPTAKA